jgi:signal transduction histidine kinase
VAARSRAALVGATALAAGALAIGLRGRTRRAAAGAARPELAALRRRIDDERRRTADAVHALRAPLTAMGAELDLGLREEGLAPPVRELLSSVREEVDAMSRTVADILALAAIDQQGLRLHRAPVALLDAVEGSARPFRRAAAAKRVALELGGLECHVHGDRGRLEQALGNLIDNAIKFTEPGGTVRVTAWCDAAQAGVTVTDSGPGVDPRARDRLFDRFYRGPGREGARGSGLGLAICREIATAHGGRVWVDSAEGRGSAFTLALPRHSGGVAPGPTPGRRRPGPAGARRGRRRLGRRRCG